MVWKKILHGTQTGGVPLQAGVFGLEEDKITWYSNTGSIHHQKVLGLEEDKITWYSNVQRSRPQSRCGLEEDKIAWYSNPSLLRITR